MVYFRHYDSDVLAFIAPLLDAEQAAKLFGPAKIFGLLGGRGAGAIVERPSDLHAPKAGTLCFFDWQLEAMGQRQIGLRRDKIASMLSEQFPGITETYSREDLQTKVLLYEDRGSSIGLRSESAYAKWAYLNMMSDQNLNENEGLMTYLRNVDQNIDQAIEESFETIIFDYKLSKNLNQLQR